MRFPRLPGFNNSRTSVRFEPVNVEALNVFAEGDVIGPAEMMERRLARRGPVKILGRGEINVKLTVRATQFSEAAIAKIEAAGGKAERVRRVDEKNRGSADASTDA
jgi:large subunit ribosomal protein L15